MVRAALLGGVACAMGMTSTAHAAELLTNGNLDSPGVHESDLATGWTLVETRTGLPAENSATMASFANHTTGGAVGLWLRSFAGTVDNPVGAELSQEVAGTPGLIYQMSGWARYETFFPSGIAGDTQDTVFALEFLDGGSSVLPGSLVVDLASNGQVNNAGWLQHTLTATAPAGTVGVRVRAAMTGGHLATGNPQSGFVDDFSLITVVPEPTSLAALSLAAVTGLQRRRVR